MHSTGCAKWRHYYGCPYHTRRLRGLVGIQVSKVCRNVFSRNVYPSVFEKAIEALFATITNPRRSIGNLMRILNHLPPPLKMVLFSGVNQLF